MIESKVSADKDVSSITEEAASKVALPEPRCLIIRSHRPIRLERDRP